MSAEQTTLILKLIELVKQWHNIGDGSYRLTPEIQEQMWKIYLEQAPEMRPVREWLAANPSVEKEQNNDAKPDEKHND